MIFSPQKGRSDEAISLKLLHVHAHISHNILQNRQGYVCWEPDFPALCWCLPITNRSIYKISVIVTRQVPAGPPRVGLRPSFIAPFIIPPLPTFGLPTPNFQNLLFTPAWGSREQVFNSLQISYLEQNIIFSIPPLQKRKNKGMCVGGFSRFLLRG